MSSGVVLPLRSGWPVGGDPRLNSRQTVGDRRYAQNGQPAPTFARAVNAAAEAEQNVDPKTPASRGVGKSLLDHGSDHHMADDSG